MKTHKDTHIKKAKSFQERLKMIRHEAEMIEKDIQDFLDTQKTESDIHGCVSLLQDAAKGIQGEVNDYIHDACLHLILTSEQETEEADNEREANSQFFYRMLHENSIRYAS